MGRPMDYERRQHVASARHSLNEKAIPHSGEELRYTAVESRLPTQFSNSGHRLLFSKGDTSIFVIITMYNEGKDELERTLRGVCENLKSFISREDMDDIWKRIVVCIVSDGRLVSSQETLEYATELGIFSQDRVAEQLNREDDTGLHLFETTVELTDQESLGTKFPPLQIMFALKEHNEGKINSHWWAFEGFASQIQPEFCFLLDVGTRPRKKALYFLWESMRRNEQIAGCCGEITTMKQFNSNPMVQAQLFEYKVSNFLDKTTESIFGYISVLPGAFSAYRFSALQGGPLQKYFHHIATPMSKLSPFEANQYLAEDRILCFELVAKQDANYTLHYDRRAVAETDAPTELVDLIKQRRRWLNGSLFATMYAVANLPRLLRYSTHSVIRKGAFLLQFILQALALVLSWFMVANFYLTFRFSAGITLGRDASFLTLKYVFVALVITQFVLGLGNRPESVKKLYSISSYVWGLFFISTAVLALSVLFDAQLDWNLVVGFLLTFGLIGIAAALHGELFTIAFSWLQYIFFAPTFMLVFLIYSFSNLHDISWGTKGLESTVHASNEQNDEQVTDASDINERVRAKLRRIERIKIVEKKETAKVQMRFQHFRSTILLTWMLSQGLYTGLMTYSDDNSGTSNQVALAFLTVMFAIVAFSNIYRFIFSMVYLVVHQLTKRRKLPAYPVPRSRSDGEPMV